MAKDSIKEKFTMTTNNQYYKQIAESLGGSEISGNHSDNYYLHLIAVHYCGNIYTQTECNGKYLKDIAEQVCDTTYTEIRFNNFYLHQWAEHLVGEELPNNSDNYFLHLIKENLGTALTIQVSNTQITYGGSVTITGNLSFRSTGIASATVKLYDGETLITDSITTDSDGNYSYTYNNAPIGTFAFNAIYEGSGDYGEASSNTINVTVNKIATTISLSSSASNVRIGSDYTISGELSIIDEGEEVVIYENGSVLETVTTMVNGEFISDSITPYAAGTNTYYAVYNGNSTHSEVTSSSVSVTVADLISTSLSIEVPLNLVYSDEFTINGMLLNENSYPISGQSVSLMVGNTVVDTEITNANGAVQFRHSPVSAGNHSFQLVFDGDENYESSSSEVVSRVVDKETSVLQVSSPSTSSVTMYSDVDLIISGTLVTDDNEAISGATVNVLENDTVLVSDTTGSDGSYSVNVDLEAGSHDLTISYGGDSNYTESYCTRSVTVMEPSISLTGDNSILSYKDGDSVNLTATLYSSTPTGQTVEVLDVSDNSVVGTMTDNGDGTYSYTYASQGVGDITFKAECGSLYSDTYTVEDWHKYDDCSTDKTSNYTKGTNASLSFSTDHYVMSTSTDDIVDILDGVDNVQFEVLLKHNNNTGGIQIRQDPSNAQNGAVGLYNNASNTTYLALFPWQNIVSRNNVTNNNDYYRYILTINGSSITATIETESGTPIFSGSTTKSLSAKHFCIFNVGNNTLNIKEIVVKPL